MYLIEWLKMFLCNIFVFFFIIFTENFVLADEDVLLQLPIGQIRGRTRTTITETTVYRFQGIPYAEPPINDRRFQPPKPKSPWAGIWDATQEGNYCHQMTFPVPNGNEDCLFVNVFTPENPNSNASLPVMFYIHGGGFIEGASAEIWYGPDRFMDYGVIIVTFNYRVGPFGFFSTGDEVVPGNNGLKDQLLALQWTNQYIEYFGGDPNKITIFGQSAGSCSVSYHILSPKSKGLFKAAIGESGSALSAWAFQSNQKEYSFRLATFVNPEFENSNASSVEVYEYLRNVPSELIDRAAYKMDKLDNPADQQIVQGFYFAPVVEHEHEDAFISKPMHATLESGEINNVPLLCGFNSEESLYFTKDNDDGSTEAYTADPLLLIPRGMHLQEKDKRTVAELIEQFYSSNGSFLENPRQLTEYFSDQSFARSIIEMASLQSRVGDVYFYQFAYRGVLGGHTNKSVIGFSGDIEHSEELPYLFSRTINGQNSTDLSKYPEMDQIVQKRMIRMFTDFAKYSNPTPEPIDLLQNITWPKVQPNNFQYMDIGSWLEIRKNPKNDMLELWKKLFSKYGVPPFYTY